MELQGASSRLSLRLRTESYVSLLKLSPSPNFVTVSFARTLDVARMTFGLARMGSAASVARATSRNPQSLPLKL